MIGAIYPCYKKPDIVRKVLTQYRSIYPNTDICLINDGGINMRDIAMEFNCKYLHFDFNNKPGFFDKKNMTSFLCRWIQALEIIENDYVIKLEDDVFVKKATSIEDLKYTVNGNCINTISVKERDIINNYNNDIQEKYYYSLHGGSIINRADFLKILKNEKVNNFILETNLGEYDHLGNLFEGQIIGDDILFSIMTYLNKFSIGPYPGHCEYFTQSYKINDPKTEVYHQFRNW